MLEDVCLQLLVRHMLVVLGGENDGVDVHRLIAVIFDRDLCLAVGTQIRQRAVLAHLGELARQRMRKVDRQRHQNRRFVAGEAEHHALIARAGIERILVDALFAL